MTELPIETHWDGPRRLRIVAPGRIEWQLHSIEAATRAMNVMGSMPDALWKGPTVLGAMAAVAGVALGTENCGWPAGRRTASVSSQTRC